MKRQHYLLAQIVLSGYIAAAGSVPSFGQATPTQDPVLVENSIVSVRKSDYERELERLPAEIRPGFANSDRRVNDLLRRMLIERTLAAQATREQLDQRPDNAARIRAELDKLHAQLKVAQVEQSAAADFDAKREAWEARARELYAADRKRYEIPERLTASHILFSTRTRSLDEALKLARDALSEVVAGADFNELARKISEDPSAKTNSGQLDWFARSDMDPAFANAAFALRSPGDVSAPVLSSFGWHLIRLDARRPVTQRVFNEVSEGILAELKQKYVNEQREAALAKVRNDPTIKANREAIDALVIRVDQEAVRRAVQLVAPGATGPPK